MKNKNDDNEVVTRGFLREALDEFATRIETRIENNVVARISAKIDEKIDTAIGNLAIMVEKGFEAAAKHVDARFDEVFGELKEVHKEIAVNDRRSRADITAIDLRVEKLEKRPVR